MKRLIVIGGPTASGKTGIAIEAALHYGTEIISADSRQCYNEMSIGTAKPSQDELNRVKHHFINSHHLPAIINAGIYSDEITPLLLNLFKEHHTVIIAGGSGLYIRALLQGLDSFPAIPVEIRSKLKDEFNASGIIPLQRELALADPEWYAAIDINNARRIQRALEITRLTGKKYSSFLGKSLKQWPFKTDFYYLNPDRNKLYTQIGERVLKMIDAGLEKEAASLLPFREHPALQTVGYKEFFTYFDQEQTLTQTIESISRHTRNYAKRQWTWFRNQGTYLPVDPQQALDIILKGQDR